MEHTRMDGYFDRRDIDAYKADAERAQSDFMVKKALSEELARVKEALYKQQIELTQLVESYGNSNKDAFDEGDSEDADEDYLDEMFSDEESPTSPIFSHASSLKPSATSPIFEHKTPGTLMSTKKTKSYDDYNNSNSPFDSLIYEANEWEKMSKDEEFSDEYTHKKHQIIQELTKKMGYDDVQEQKRRLLEEQKKAEAQRVAQQKTAYTPEALKHPQLRDLVLLRALGQEAKAYQKITGAHPVLMILEHIAQFKTVENEQHSLLEWALNSCHAPSAAQSTTIANLALKMFAISNSFPVILLLQQSNLGPMPMVKTQTATMPLMHHLVNTFAAAPSAMPSSEFVQKLQLCFEINGPDARDHDGYTIMGHINRILTRLSGTAAATLTEAFVHLATQGADASQLAPELTKLSTNDRIAQLAASHSERNALTNITNSVRPKVDAPVKPSGPGRI